MEEEEEVKMEEVEQMKMEEEEEVEEAGEDPPVVDAVHLQAGEGVAVLPLPLQPELGHPRVGPGHGQGALRLRSHRPA